MNEESIDVSEALSLTPPAARPLAIRPMKPALRVEPPVAPTRPVQAAVLVVEANPGRRALSVRVLRRMTGLDVVGLSTCEEAREHVARTPAALVVASMDLGDEGPAEALTLLTGLRAPVLIMSGQVQPLQVDAGNVEVVPRAPLADLREHILGSLESRLWETLHAQHGGPVDVDEAADDEECAACADTIETMVDEILEGHERIALPAPEDFDLLMERAFDALLANDRQAAWKALHAARLLRPDHGLVKANLARLLALGVN
ncbi:MAG: hypothetical protein R3F60_23115 [bacterium]